MKYRNERRFLTLFAACVVSICLGAYLSYQAASLQDDPGPVAVTSVDISASRPAPEAAPASSVVATAAQSVDPEPVSSIAAQTQVVPAVSEASADEPKPTKVSLNQDAQLVLAYANADAKPDLRASGPADAALPETAQPQPDAAKTAEAPQPPAPLPPVALAAVASKSVPLPPRRPASLMAAVAPAPVEASAIPQLIPAAAPQPVPAAAPQAAAPQAPAPQAAPQLQASPAPAAPVAAPVAPALTAAVTPKAPAPSTAAQVPVPAPARVEAKLEAPANPLPSITDALAAVTASVGGANAGLPPEAAPVPAPEVAGGFKLGQQVYIRIFKQEGSLELWMKRGDSYALYRTFAVCKMSGALGPKTKQSDYQSPEGFYSVSARQLNPHSHYHLAFDVGYPNAYDRRQGYTGSAVMVHGDCKSVGCFAMTDAGIDQIYPIVAAALAAGQREVPVHIFPFRMTEQAIARESSGGSSFLAFLDNGAPKRDWSAFWRNLKQGYDMFEHSRVPPVAYACGDRYEFGGAGAACARIAGW